MQETILLFGEITAGLLVGGLAVSSISHWGLIDGMKLARTVGRHLANRQTPSPQEFIEAAEKAARKHPDEWVIWFTLGDKCQAAGQYVRSLQACKRCVELRPNDIRSAYALATAYNVLTRASWVAIEPQIAALTALLSTEGVDEFSPLRSELALTETDMVIDTAAVHAMRWFERALRLNPDASSLMQIRQDLGALYRRFPHLKS